MTYVSQGPYGRTSHQAHEGTTRICQEASANVPASSACVELMQQRQQYQVRSHGMGQHLILNDVPIGLVLVVVVAASWIGSVTSPTRATEPALGEVTVLGALVHGVRRECGMIMKMDRQSVDRGVCVTISNESDWEES